MAGEAEQPADATADRNRIDGEALAAWMTANVAGFEGPLNYTKFPGGQSNPTYRIDAASGSYVLRRKPFGPVLPSAHAVDREHALIAALHPTGFPVPRPLALCTDESVIGAIFYIMEMVEGRSFWDGALPAMSRDQRRATYESMIDTLAALHRIDPVAVGLGDYGKPGNYFERQVARWTKQYRASETDRIEEIERLMDWLPRTLPEQRGVAIVHGDYRLDNLIFDDDGSKVLAVLDWELSTLGDPLADFSYLLMNWVTPAEGHAGIGGLNLEAKGIPTLDEAVARYCAATGRDGLPALDWYFAYNFFRLAGIVQGIRKRVIDGTASSALGGKMAERVFPLSQAAWHFAERAGA